MAFVGVVLSGTIHPEINVPKCVDEPYREASVATITKIDDLRATRQQFGPT
jgi:hypothetical protein